MNQSEKGTVLVLGTYPIVEPKHGGQIRLLNIKRAYERAGWTVISLSVYSEESYSRSSVGPLDVPFSSSSRYRLSQTRLGNLIIDFLSGGFAAAEDGGLRQILANLPKGLDVIHVEQPWLWPLIAELRSRTEYSRAVLVYGSQNIEAPLRKCILDSYGLEDSQNVIAAIDELERRAAREADLALAVTREEALVLSQWGARTVLRLPNGIEPWQADDRLVADWRNRLPRHKWMIFVGSAHPPNFAHFMDIFGGSLACFPPLSRLVVAGSVSEYIRSVVSAAKWSSLNLSRLQFLSTLSDEDLAAVKTLAHGFVLPIPFGGGSNIKTAEALYSGKYVVGTPAAFRGYESFSSLPEVKVAADPQSFHRAIREVVSVPYSEPLIHDRSGALDARQNLQWDNCLVDLPVEVEKIRRQKVYSE